MKRGSFGEMGASLSAEFPEKKYTNKKIKDGTHEGYDGITFETKDEEIISVTIKGHKINKGDKVLLTVRTVQPNKNIQMKVEVLSFKPAHHQPGVKYARNDRNLINEPEIKPVIDLWVSTGERYAEDIRSDNILGVSPL